jgi:hypothetical protein
MNEYLATLDPVSLAYCLMVSIASLIGLAIFAYHYSINNFDVGVALGKSMHKLDIFNAENKSYLSGYEKGRENGILLGRLQWQNVESNTAKAPVKQTAKPNNKRRASSVPNSPKTTHKKPVKGAKAK